MIRIHSRWSILAIATFTMASVVLFTAIFWTVYPYKTSDIVEPINIMNKNVPGDAEVGSTCHFEFQNFYKVNPIRDIVKTWISEDFKIIEGGIE